MLSIQNPPGIPLPPEAEAILQKLFPTHQRIIILAEMGGGYGGGRIIKVRPIDMNGRQEMPTIVKMGPKPLIEQEWTAYTDYIHNRLAQAANIQAPPVFTKIWGGLRYRLAGDGVFDFESLINYCRDTKNSIDDILYVLEKQLFRIMGPWWRELEFEPAFQLGASYDPLLPINFIIRPAKLAGTAIRKVQPYTNPSLQIGDIVRLEGFQVTEVDINSSTITLDRPSAYGSLPNSYRVRVQPVENLETVQVGKVIEPIIGEVMQTRHDLLLAEVQSVMEPELDLLADNLNLANDVTLPNPLQQLKTILQKPFDVYVTSIHGDFNIENILVNGDSRTTYLIDFADARRDHVLHDLLRLETGIITGLLPDLLAEAASPAESVRRFYEQLHCTMADQSGILFARSQNGQTHDLATLAKPFAIIKTIRKTAHDLLFNKADWTEYYHGLTIYLLGALKFKNLDSLAKQVAFWGAATIQKIVTHPPLCPKQRLLSAYQERVIVSVLFAVVLIAGGYFSWRSFSSSLPQGEPLAVLLNFDPEVAVQRRDSSSLEEASFPQELFQEDVVLTYENASALIYCQENGLFFQLPAESTMAITCEETDDPRLIARLESTRITFSEPISITLAPDNTRSSRGERVSIPILLSPRNTFIAENRPTFTWQPVEGANGYRVSVSVGGGRSWSRETTDSSLPYPADEPPLEPASVNIVTLVTLDDTFTADTSLLRVLDEAALASLTEQETAIRSLELDPASQTYLLAQLYQEKNLWAAAIAELNRLAQSETPLAASVWQQLGDLYFASELYALAEENYQMALDTAVDADDLNGQAAAYIGLSQTTHAFKETEQAIEYLETAENLYRQAGQEALADFVESEKDRLER